LQRAGRGFIEPKIDVAVHSLKDLPTELHPDLALAATLPRHDPVDVLISKTANSFEDPWVESSRPAALAGPAR
jgi:porphobilinogen deaminase